MANEKRLIDANEVIKETESILNFRRQHNMPTAEYEALLGYLKNRPTVDAVEVVRCKDCKHYGNYGRVWDCKKYGAMSLPEENDFCSYGERKDNEC
jgi:hypothetical protein